MKKVTEAKDVEEAYNKILDVEGTFSEIVYEPEVLIREAPCAASAPTDLSTDI